LSFLFRQEKIELRRSYRKLIEDTTNNKDELVKPNNDGLMQNIAKAQELFKNGKFSFQVKKLYCRRTT